MPYITQEKRMELNPILVGPAAYLTGCSLGELNYALSVIVREYFVRAPSYSRIADITGVLENVKQEFYRRVASPYEDKKIAENGDVY